MKAEDKDKLREVVSLEANAGLSDDNIILLTAAVVRIAKDLQRTAVKECNRILTLGEKSTQACLEFELESLAKLYGLRFSVDGDPRGYVVKLHTPKSGKFNSFGGQEEGWGIA